MVVTNVVHDVDELVLEPSALSERPPDPLLFISAGPRTVWHCLIKLTIVRVSTKETIKDTIRPTSMEIKQSYQDKWA